MRLAIPEHQGRVAPVFDACRRILIVDEAEESRTISVEDWSHANRHNRPARLKELEIDTLLCGGISCRMEERIRALDIELTPWLAGEVNEILAAFREGRISDPQYAMPGRRAGLGCVEGSRAPDRTRCRRKKRGVDRCRVSIEEDPWAKDP